MGPTLHLMVLESHPGAATHAVRRLEQAGHVIHRCHGADGPAFPCNGVADGADCPADRPIDVALVVRKGITPRPTPTEDGVSCALRAGIPLVEDGADLLDPYAPFITARVWADDNVVEVCERAVAEALRPLEDQVRASLQPFLEAAGRESDAVEVHLDAAGDVLRVHLVGDDLSSQLSGLLGVKAVDRLRELQRRWAHVEVSVTDRSAPRSGT
jgi:hypothetical protein